MIVESPAKAKTIEDFLDGKFVVRSCYGHIRDLVKENKGIDIEKNYTPTYKVHDDKKEIVKELKKMAKDAENVWLATDEDREGEAISWHLCEVLDLPVDEAKRIVFHEITKQAIQNALNNPRPINIDLVNAQQARRILDRLVGFELSPILWKKISSSERLSAGRVQSVSVRLIVERERAIKAFVPESSFKVAGLFIIQNDDGKSTLLKAELNKKFSSEKEAEEFLSKCKDADYIVKDVKVKPSQRSPAAPFTTSTIQQEASRKLGYSVAKTMTIAQKLYEAGHITYMRTDSVNLSELAMKTSGKEISAKYGEKYAQSRQYKTKSAGAQEAHEAIRPTDFSISTVEAGNDEQRLYELIWKRAIASQMSDAQLEKTTVTIGISSTSEEFKATGEVILFDGFLKVYIESSEDEDEKEDEETLMPAMKVGQRLGLEEINATERFSRPPARFNEAGLVRKLEELGIGRPSTYAPTISTIQKRGYVIKEVREGVERKYKVVKLKDKEITSREDTEITGAENNKLFPTDKGSVVNDFLLEHFEKVMDYNFTAQIEKEFDNIAHEGKAWVEMIDDFYKPFHSTIEAAEGAERFSGERELGTDPKTGKPVFAKVGKYGSMVQLGKTDDEERPKFARILPPHELETITLEDALELFKLPRIVGTFEDQELAVSVGRYGPYVRHDGKFFSLEKGKDIFSTTEEEAIQAIKDKRQADKEKIIKVFEEDESIQILKGRYGPYMTNGEKNAPIPKERRDKPEEFTLEECKEIIKNYVPKRKFKRKPK